MGNLSDYAFDANEVEPSGAFDTLPKGDYQVMIIDSEMKDTSTGNGRYLKLELEVIEGKYKGRYLFCNLNLENKSEMAVQIARATLSAICRAVGVLTPKDSLELHNKPLIAVVRVSQDAQYGERNEVKGFKAIAKGDAAAIASSPAKLRKDIQEAQGADSVPF